MIASKILEAIANCFYVFLLLIFVRCLLTWFPFVNWENPVIKVLRLATDGYLNWFRKFIPPLGQFDLSPMVAGFALILLRNATLVLAKNIMIMLGFLR